MFHVCLMTAIHNGWIGRDHVEGQNIV